MASRALASEMPSASSDSVTPCEMTVTRIALFSWCRQQALLACFLEVEEELWTVVAHAVGFLQVGGRSSRRTLLIEPIF